MVDEQLQSQLVAMRAEDARVRKELLEAGKLGGPYVPEMEAVHLKNATKLRVLLQMHGWPVENIAGKDGAEAAWFIAQHAVGEPAFQRHCLEQLRAVAGRVPAWHAAYLEDRIAFQEGRKQRYGTQWVRDSVDGEFRPSPLVAPDRVNVLRAQVGLPPLSPIPPRGPALAPDQQAEIQADNQWWEEWFVRKGWRE
jgi:hypothetical protein